MKKIMDAKVSFLLRLYGAVVLAAFALLFFGFFLYTSPVLTILFTVLGSGIAAFMSADLVSGVADD